VKADILAMVKRGARNKKKQPASAAGGFDNKNHNVTDCQLSA